MDTNRKSLIEALRDAVKRADMYESGIVKMSTEVAEMVIEAIQGPGWISVEERLPEDDVHVLCRIEQLCDYPDEHKFDVPSHYVCEGYCDNRRWYVRIAPDIRMMKKVTHWMPLPEGPQ